MFDLKYEDRLKSWSYLRQDLETSKDPFGTVIAFYNQAPRVSIHTDPYDKTSWPDPWELVQENQYCDFCIVLGMCYSLQLTDRFSGSNFEIHIGIDKQNSRTEYFLLLDNSKVIGWNNQCIDVINLPKTIESQVIYTMEPLQ